MLTLLDGKRGALKRGEYLFKAGISMNDIESLLASHRVVQHKLTIPEGLTSDQIVQRLRDDDVLVGDIKEIPREGSLMPDTYYFERGDTRQSLLTRMAKAQAKFVDEIWKKRAPDLPVKSPGEMVTLASIVEKETGKADERPRVAGVFVNRLQKHMRLEFDPTIVYGLVFGKGTLGHPITRAELNQPTPYNTYIIDGLPPGPISNPGKAALEAVANPARSKDLYFVADGTGGHVFADTLDQHLKNVARWRQIEKDAKDRLAPDVTPQPASAIHGSIDSDRPGVLRRADRPGAGADRAREPSSPASPSSAPDGARQPRRSTSLGRRRRAANRSRSSAPSSPASTTLRRRATRLPTPTRPPPERAASPPCRSRPPCSPISGRAKQIRNAGCPTSPAAARAPSPPSPRRRSLRPPRAGRASTTRPRARSSIRCSTRPTT